MDTTHYVLSAHAHNLAQYVGKGHQQAAGALRHRRCSARGMCSIELWFNYFAFSLIDADKSLRYYVQAFGTDSDTNLSDALNHCFPFITVVCCFIHFECNM